MAFASVKWSRIEGKVFHERYFPRGKTAKGWLLLKEPQISVFMFRRVLYQIHRFGNFYSLRVPTTSYHWNAAGWYAINTGMLITRIYTLFWYETMKFPYLIFEILIFEAWWRYLLSASVYFVATEAKRLTATIGVVRQYTCYYAKLEPRGRLF